MADAVYLAMTGAEFSAVTTLPPKIGWMACHFSPYGRGLCNLPPVLPPGSLLILNDRIPFHGHDFQKIADQLKTLAADMGYRGILLDFQRLDIPELRELTRLLTASLPCPLAVTADYADDSSCAVFLPPCPHHTPLDEHVAPWKDREIWLDLAVDAETITLTKTGSSILPLPLGEIPEGGQKDPDLHCHYSIESTADFARFTLWRTKEDLQALAQDAQALGISILVGLYQEWI